MKTIIFLFLIAGCSEINNNTRSFEFTYFVELMSTKGKKLEVWIPLPQSNEVQTISNLQIATNLKYTIENELQHNNKYLYINDKKGTTEKTSITIKFNTVRKEHQNVQYNNVSPNNYLSSNLSVPIGDIFDKVISDNNLSKSNIRRIYDYVLEGMHYGKPTSTDNKYYMEPWLNANDKYGLEGVNRDEIVNLYKKAKQEGGNYTFGNGNSIYACKIGVGNCTDYHSYFMSLNRTMGIPARFHMGFPIPDAENGSIGGYHCWADYYVQGKGWYPVDISEADKRPDEEDYFFGNLCNNRVEFVVGRDIKLKGYENGTANIFIYPIIEINDVQSSEYNKKFTYKNL